MMEAMGGGGMTSTSPEKGGDINGGTMQVKRKKTKMCDFI